jgi:hypothetical protein
MRSPEVRSAGRRHRVAAAAVTGLLALAGIGCIGLAASRQHAPQPPLWTENVAGQQAGELAPARGVHPQPRVKGLVLPASAPIALAIPAIRIRTSLVRLGLTADGSMEVPTGAQYDLAGWYRHSPPPGSQGPAVIVGHVDSAAQGPSVFFRLGDVRPRHTVLITRADGSVAVFVVDTVRRYAKRQFPVELVYGDTDHAALRLITCGGRFDRASGHYLDNIVVTASLVRRSPGPGRTTAGVTGPGQVGWR